MLSRIYCNTQWFSSARSSFWFNWATRSQPPLRVKVSLVRGDCARESEVRGCSIGQLHVTFRSDILAFLPALSRRDPTLETASRILTFDREQFQHATFSLIHRARTFARFTRALYEVGSSLSPGDAVRHRPRDVDDSTVFSVRLNFQVKLVLDGRGFARSCRICCRERGNCCYRFTEKEKALLFERDLSN